MELGYAGFITGFLGCFQTRKPGFLRSLKPGFFFQFENDRQYCRSKIEMGDKKRRKCSYLILS